VLGQFEAGAAEQHPGMRSQASGSDHEQVCPEVVPCSEQYGHRVAVRDVPSDRVTTLVTDSLDAGLNCGDLGRATGVLEQADGMHCHDCRAELFADRQGSAKGDLGVR
jgi:hypothetical protein